MILGVGTDMLDVRRIDRLLKRFPERFAMRILHTDENVDSVRDALFLAKRFAAKEAVAKACGTGISGMVGFADICISKTGVGQPVVTLSEHAQNKLCVLHSVQGPIKVHLSWADETPYILAFAMIESPDVL